MFKRYSNKAIFENEESKSRYDEETSTATMQAPAFQNEGGNTFQASPSKDHYVQDAPPRIFEQRSSKQQQQPPAIKPVFLQPSSQEKSFTPHQPPSWEGEASPPLQGEEPETTLGEGVVFKGELSFKKLLRIDGCFEGELSSDGKLIVGSTGLVKANNTIHLKEVIIEGFFEGDIHADERIELRKDAQVHGNITTKFLSVDEGVTIIGTVNVSPHDKKKDDDESEDSEEKDDSDDKKKTAKK
jgi:cytoskeletal protein CcmA (bactofilin family)